jgi:putative flavoprotein involved in K+ transport
MSQHVTVAVIGGSQAGLSMSYYLSVNNINHVVFEKNRIAHSWRTQRWDSFCLVTPNWQCKLPGYDYPGNDPDGFMVRDDIVAYVESYARRIRAPLKEGTGVTMLTRAGNGFRLETTDGAYTADAVVLAVGGYHQPNIPRLAERLPPSILQLHSSTYRNSRQLPPGEVLVVGSGQSGCQIAEDLHLDGRKTHMVVGSAPRCPRGYRGKDAVDWLADLGQYDLPVDQHPLREKVRKKANHYLTGRDGGRDTDLRKFAQEGMQLHGRLTDFADGTLRFADDLEKNLDAADASYNNICAMIDKYIEAKKIPAPDGHRYAATWRPESPVTELDPIAQGITSVIWSTGFRADWPWVDLPIFDGAGYPTHKRGVTSMPGVYVLGLPWLYTWGSGRFVGVGRDAGFLAGRIVDHLAVAEAVS